MQFPRLDVTVRRPDDTSHACGYTRVLGVGGQGPYNITLGTREEPQLFVVDHRVTPIDARYPTAVAYRVDPMLRVIRSSEANRRDLLNRSAADLTSSLWYIQPGISDRLFRDSIGEPHACSIGSPFYILEQAASRHRVLLPVHEFKRDLAHLRVMPSFPVPTRACMLVYSEYR